MSRAANDKDHLRNAPSRDLAMSSSHEYETRLRCKTAGLAMKQLQDEVVDERRHS